ncbi:MAG: C45 family autoproteolytic acyltransferase/hydrolase [bacterium]|nr:C45 family autoproteolytic acyltransferase/hydrolase [bacterium]
MKFTQPLKYIVIFFLLLFNCIYLYSDVSIRKFTPIPIEETLEGRFGFALKQKDINGITIIHIKGTPYQMGYQIGFLLKKELTKVYDEAFSNTSINNAIKKQDGINHFIKIWEKAEPFINKKILDEIQGISDGSGIPVDIIKSAAVLSETNFYGCSNFVVWGKATADKELLHGRNLDVTSRINLHKYPVIIIRYNNDNVSADIGFLGQIGTLTAMNNNGMTVAIDDLFGYNNRTFSGIPRMILAREIMERKRQKEVITLLKSAQKTIGTIYILSNWTERNACVVDTDAKYSVVRGPSTPKRSIYANPYVLIATNFSFSEYFKTGQGYDRYYKLAEGIYNSYGTINIEKAILLLQSVSEKNTIQSVVFKPSSLDFWVAYSDGKIPAPYREFVHYNLKNLIDTYHDKSKFK